MDSTLNHSLYFPDIPMPTAKQPGYEGILTNESPNHNNLRTKSVEGQFRKLPEEGRAFFIFGEPLNKAANLRSINTSPVKSIKHELRGSTMLFKTETGSTYRLDYYRIEEV